MHESEKHISEPQRRATLDLLIIYGNIYMIHLRALAPVRPEWMFEPGENIYLQWSDIKAFNTLNGVWEKIPRAITNDTEEGRSLGN